MESHESRSQCVFCPLLKMQGIEADSADSSSVVDAARRRLNAAVLKAMQVVSIAGKLERNLLSLAYVQFFQSM